MNKHIFLIGIISSSIFCSNIPTAKIKTGAGILPLVCNQSNQQYYFLLGTENRHDGYYSHGTYSDFGGTSKYGEVSDQTALREFREETGLDDFVDLAFDGINLNACYYSVMEFKENGLTDFTYSMYLLPITYEQIKSEIFRNALKRRDGEKSAIALFPVIPFVKNFENFQKKPNTTHEIYQEIVDGKTIEYPIRRSFRKSLQIMIQESTFIRDILNTTKIGNNLTVEIICEDEQTDSAIGNNNQVSYRKSILLSLAFIGSIGIIALLFLGKNYFFKVTPTVC